MRAQSFINEEHGYYRISKDNISLLIENYCQELGDNFIVYIDKDNDFDNFRNVTELVTSVLEQKQLEYKIVDMPIDRCIEWLIPNPLNNKEIYRHRYIEIHWYSIGIQVKTKIHSSLRVRKRQTFLCLIACLMILIFYHGLHMLIHMALDILNSKQVLKK